MISDEIEKAVEVRNGFSETPDMTGSKVNIEISGACNESCIYCYSAACGKHKSPKMIDDNLFYRVTKEARELGADEIGLYIQGEPLTNPKICNYINYLKKELKYRYVYISSNGILCTADRTRQLAEAGVDSIKFSISSVDKENFIRHHGVDGCDKCIENVKYVYNYRKEQRLDYKIYMFSIITKFNEWEIENIKKTYEPFVDELVFCDVLGFIYEMKGIKEYLTPDVGRYPYTGSDVDLPCPQLFNRIVINEDGKLCTCCYTMDDYTIVKDLNVMSLRDALYSDDMKSIRLMHLSRNVKGTICDKCVNDSNDRIYPFCKKLDKSGKYPPVLDHIPEIKRRFKAVLD